MSQLLRMFYNDKNTKEEVHAYLVDFLKEEGVRKLFDKEDTAGVAEAKEMIDKAFDNLEVLFASKSAPKNINNEAR